MFGYLRIKEHTSQSFMGKRINKGNLKYPELNDYKKLYQNLWIAAKA